MDLVIYLSLLAVALAIPAAMFRLADRFGEDPPPTRPVDPPAEDPPT